MRATYCIKDNVCTPYKLILSQVGQFLEANGWKPEEDPARAGTIIVGACGAFHSLAGDALQLMVANRKQPGKLIAFGCLVNIFPDQVAAVGPDQIIAPPDWETFEQLVPNPEVPLNAVVPASEFRLKEEYRRYDPGKRFLLLQTGCSSDCPHCPHKLGIGALRSRPAQDILAQAAQLVAQGAHTLILTGNDTGSYGTDARGPLYPELLRMLTASGPLLHVSQLNADWAWVYREELFPLLAHPVITDVQILIQSVSPDLLGVMRRKPIVKKLGPYLAGLKESRPDILLRTDVIMGYPGSKEEEDLETLEFVASYFDEIAVHGFERFPTTKIASMPLDFHTQDIVNARVDMAMNFFKQHPGKLVHRGGQVYATLEAIEAPKEKLRLVKGFQRSDPS